MWTLDKPNAHKHAHTHTIYYSKATRWFAEGCGARHILETPSLSLGWGPGILIVILPYIPQIYRLILGHYYKVSHDLFIRVILTSSVETQILNSLTVK